MLGRPPFVNALSPLPCAQNGNSTKMQAHQAHSLDSVRHRQDPPYLCLFFPHKGSATFFYRDTSDTAAGWTSFSSRDSWLGVVGCAPITLIKRSVLSLGDGCVRLLDRECQMLHSVATWMSYHQTDVGPYFCALHQKHPSLAWAWNLLSIKALLVRISDISITVHTFSALIQKQKSFPWSMLNAEWTHPSLISFSYFCFHIDLCYHKKVFKM